MCSASTGMLMVLVLLFGAGMFGMFFYAFHRLEESERAAKVIHIQELCGGWYIRRGNKSLQCRTWRMLEQIPSVLWGTSDHGAKFPTEEWAIYAKEAYEKWATRQIDSVTAMEMIKNGPGPLKPTNGRVVDPHDLNSRVTDAQKYIDVSS